MKKLDRLNEAATEAQRFLRRVAEFSKDRQDGGYHYGTKASGAVRRASLDLSRALAAYRLPE